MLRQAVRKILAASTTWQTHSLAWNTRSDKQRNRRSWLNTEIMKLWVRTRMLKRLPTTPKKLVKRVAPPEHSPQKK
jgi:hypothetical protein